MDLPPLHFNLLKIYGIYLQTQRSLLRRFMKQILQNTLKIQHHSIRWYLQDVPIQQTLKKKVLISDPCLGLYVPLILLTAQLKIVPGLFHSVANSHS